MKKLITFLYTVYLNQYFLINIHKKIQVLKKNKYSLY